MTPINERRSNWKSEQYKPCPDCGYYITSYDYPHHPTCEFWGAGPRTEVVRPPVPPRKSRIRAAVTYASQPPPTRDPRPGGKPSPFEPTTIWD